MSNIRIKLASGGCVIGSWIHTASPVVTELMAAAGFDFLAIDAEHSPVDIPQAQVLFQAMRSGNAECAAMVRLPATDYAVTKHYLDAGAIGVIAPLVNEAEQAKELVRAIKYPPVGDRGVGYCRANLYGMDFDRAVSSANDRTLLCVQIEHIEAVRNINEILSVPGVDAAFVGPYDLSASMGIVRQLEHPHYKAALEQILAACKQHNVAPGIHVVQPNVDEVRRRLDEGYRFIAYSLDVTMLSEASITGLETIRKFMP